MSTSKRTAANRLPIEMRGPIGPKEADNVADQLAGLAVVDSDPQPEARTPVRARDANPDDLADEVTRLQVVPVSIPGLLHLGVEAPVSIRTFADMPLNMFLYIFRILREKRAQEIFDFSSSQGIEICEDAQHELLSKVSAVWGPLRDAEHDGTRTPE